MRSAVLFLLALPACAAASCACASSFNACHEAAVSAVVFIGTVESIEPSFLNEWNLSQRTDLLRLNEDYARARQNPSPAALASLKTTYLKVFPKLSEDRKRKLDSAKTTSDLASLFYRLLDNGKHVRFQVKESFKDPEDEDDPETLEVWTPFGDCGYDFQLGETYLVYADDDEESEMLSTGVCGRTRRLTDVTDDLAYLFFLKNDAERASRLEGFATTNELYQTEIDKLHDPQTVKAPVPGVMIVMESPAGRRHVKTGDNGRFVFDGLAAGDYKLSVFTAAYPREVQPLAAPKQIKVEEKACITHMVLLPK